MKRCELLIPAGGKEQFIAAVENGADAVYAGGRLFNARINAGNFSDEELKSAIDYAHIRGVKVYVTMNTLLTDGELEEAFRAAREYYLMGADGLIIQDLGLGALVKENLPDACLHLSTQAGVYDAEGALAAAGLGYKRVVAAREMAFEEIKKAVATGVEIEVFVHGALCICYSGQCQLSRYIGGRSGNKGTCAQPCRLPYTGAEGEPYPLSPKDLCLAEEVGALAEAGVASLKVEGRMKSPEYVAVVTAVYRRLLDEFYESGQCALRPEEAAELAQIFNRGGFTKGYFYGNLGRQLMAADFPKNAGVRVGAVLKGGRGPLIEIEASELLQKGDYVEIRGEELTGNLLTYVKELAPTGKAHAAKEAPASAAPVGGRGKAYMTAASAADKTSVPAAFAPRPAYILQIGDIKKAVKKGAPVYRLTSDSLMKKAAASFRSLDFAEGRYLRRIPVLMKAAVKPGKPASLEVKLAEKRDGEDFAVMVFGAAATESDNSRSCAETFRRQLAKTGGTPYTTAVIDIEEKETCYLSAADMNDLRRRALEALSAKLKETVREDRRRKLAEREAAASDAAQTADPRPAAAMQAGSIVQAGAAQTGAPPACDLLELYFYDSGTLTSCAAENLLAECRKAFSTVRKGELKIRALLPMRRYEKWKRLFPADGEAIEAFAYLPPVGKGKADAWIKENAERISSLLRQRNTGLYVGNLNSVETFARMGVKVVGDSSLNAFNRKSTEVIRSLGATEVIPSLEAATKSMGPYPLMITEHRFDTDSLTDRKGQSYRLLWDDFAEKTVIMARQGAADIRTCVKEAFAGKAAPPKTARIYICPDCLPEATRPTKSADPAPRGGQKRKKNEAEKESL